MKLTSKSARKLYDSLEAKMSTSPHYNEQPKD